MAHLTGQLSFLTDAAHLLAKTSPETSAYLMHQRNSLLLAHDVVLPDVQKQHVCSSCGHILIPGQGDALKVNAQRLVRKKRGSHPPAPKASKKTPREKTSEKEMQSKTAESRRERAVTTKDFTCGMCKKYTRIALAPPSPITPRKKSSAIGRSTDHVQIPAQAADGTGPEKAAMPSANAGSKKRAKSRKAGLQALLSQARRDQVQKPALTLADFMMK